MRTRKLRLVSALLALAMMFVLLPTAAFAEDDIDSTKGKLLASGTEISDEYVTHNGSVYQMKDGYTAPVKVTAASTVTINITGDITYTGADATGQNRYAIVANNPNGKVIVNNIDHKFHDVSQQRGLFGILYVNGGNAEVTGGYYTAETNNIVVLFYNNEGTLTLNDINASGQICVHNRTGITTINGGSYRRVLGGSTQGAFTNAVGGTMNLNDVEVSADCGSAVVNTYGVLKIKGGTFSSKDDNCSAILADTGTQDFWESAPDPTVMNTSINGATIKNSNRGIEIKNGNVNLVDATFKGNKKDLYLDAGQKITIDENYSSVIKVDCSDMSENRPITTASDKNNQKNFNLVSANDDYIIGYKENDDGTFCRCLEKRIGYLVTVINGIATTNDETSELDNLTQICKGTKVAVVANPANNGMRFNEWQIVDKNGALIATSKDEKFTFEMPDRDVTAEAVYQPIPDHKLTVSGGTFTVDGTEVEGDSADVQEGAEVKVTFKKDSDAGSNLVFDGWEIEGLENAEQYQDKESFAFAMPKNGVTIAARTKTVEEDSGWDAGTVVTTAVLGTGMAVLAYHIGTEVYAEQVLGAGVAVPRTRGDVALKAWELAGKPAVENAAVAPEEAAQAQQWVLESGLMENQKDGTFHPEKWMSRLAALRVLDQAQKMG